jgi:hypothetical protein
MEKLRRMAFKYGHVGNMLFHDVVTAAFHDVVTAAATTWIPSM